jgi:hypothetical protein
MIDATLRHVAAINPDATARLCADLSLGALGVTAAITPNEHFRSRLAQQNAVAFRLIER